MGKILSVLTEDELRILLTTAENVIRKYPISISDIVAIIAISGVMQLQGIDVIKKMVM